MPAARILMLSLSLAGCTPSGGALQLTGDPAAGPADTGIPADVGGADTDASSIGGVTAGDPGAIPGPPRGAERPADEPREYQPLALTSVGRWDERALLEEAPQTPERFATFGPGLALGDLSGDGWLDLVVAFPDGDSRVFLNDGAGRLEMAPGWTLDGEPLGSALAAALADLDGDGLMDAYLGRHRGQPDEILLSTGAGFTRAQVLDGADGPYKTGSFADADGDGDLDLFIAGFSPTSQDIPSSGSRLYINDGGRLIEDGDRLPSKVRGSSAYQGGWLDADDDGDMDLYMVNDRGPEDGPNQLLINDGEGTFKVAGACGCDVAMSGMGFAAADVDGDGLLDIFASDWGGDLLLRNLGGSFVDVSLVSGLIDERAEERISWGARFVDLDMDGHEDLAVMAGEVVRRRDITEGVRPDYDQPDALYLAAGDGTFTDAGPSLGFDRSTVGRAVVSGDIDRDGVPDLVTAGWFYVEIWRTDGGYGPGLSLALAGPPGNPQGVGTRVRASVDGRVLHRWQLPGGTYSSAAPEVLLGLGPARAADWIEVTWPDGRISTAGRTGAGARLSLSWEDAEPR